MTKKILLILLNLFIIGCIVLIGLAPIIPAVIAAEVAEVYSCTLNESGVHPCLINGVDYGETLLTMGMLAWLGIASIPIAIGLFVIYGVIWGIILLVIVFRKLRGKPTT